MSRIAKDLGDRFAERLRQIMSDSVDTMLTADVDERDIANIMLSVLLSETALGACCCGVSVDDYALISREAHRRARPEAARLAKLRAKAMRER